MNEHVSILVLSDLHAKTASSAAGSTDSHFTVGANARYDENSPSLSFKRLIQTEKLKADYVVCCGDLCDQADKEGFKVAWRFLHDVKKQLGAKDLIVTAGNHDVDSRGLGNPSPLDFLKSPELKPRFPCNLSRGRFDRYWSRCFYTLEQGPVRFLVINTNAIHGVGEEHNWGRITDTTLNEIKSALKKSVPREINLCICHHHPHRHPEIPKDYDDIRGGQLFLDMLAKSGEAPWIVIHGHKHHPRLGYAQGNSRSAAVFSAGSFSARLYPELERLARNQFYLLKFPLSEIHRLRTTVATFQSWTWFEGSGWARSPIGSGLPAYGGIGYRDVVSLAARLQTFRTRKILRWEDLVRLLPEILYLAPDDLEHFLYLVQVYGFRTVRNLDSNLPAQIVRA